MLSSDWLFADLSSILEWDLPSENPKRWWLWLMLLSTFVLVLTLPAC